MAVAPLSLNGFAAETLLKTADGLSQPIALEFLPDNRMLVVEKSGKILIVDLSTLQTAEYLRIVDINFDNERGLLDIALDPNFAVNGYVYVYYTPASDQHARISRFTHRENSGGLTSDLDPNSELVLWTDTDTYIACCHYGGGLDFGIDGKLWLTTSDKFATTAPGEGSNQNPLDLPADLTSTSGKIIRINPDGSIPDGSDGWIANPFINSASDPLGNIPDSIWAYGLRNPFRASWDLEYGNFYIGEVGGNQTGLSSENLHIASLDQPGVFYGWPFYEGVDDTLVNTNNEPLRLSLPLPDGDLGDPANGDFYSSPIFSYERGSGASITGGDVYRGDMFPSEWNGVYFYGDYARNQIRYLILDATGRQVLGDFDFLPTAEIPTTPSNVVWLGEGKDGALYYIRYSSGGGEVRRVTYGEQNSPPVVDDADAVRDANDPLNFDFTAIVSDLDGDDLTYVWTFGDGSPQVSGTPDLDGSISVNHSYAAEGFYTAILQVTDGLATVFSAPLNVTAGTPNNPPGITDATVLPGFAQIDDALTFSASVFDLDGDAITYVWTFGDGTSESGTVAANGLISVSHAFATDGFYVARLQLTDAEGAVTLSEEFPIQIGGSGGLSVTNGLVLDLQSTIKIGLSGSTVTGWLDGSGQGNNLAAIGAPQYVLNATPTGLPALVFDGVDDALARQVTQNNLLDGLPSGSSDRTIFFVADYVNGRKPVGVIYGEAQNGEAFGIVANGRSSKLGVEAYGKVIDSGALSGNNDGEDEWIVQSAVVSGNTVRQYLNGVLIDTDPYTFGTDTTSLASRLVIGQTLLGDAFSALAVGAVLVYDRALSESERLAVEAFLQQKYITGTTVSNSPPTGAPTASLPDGVEDNATLITEASLLEGFSDPDGDPLDVSGLTASVGVITDNGNDTFTLTAPADFSGPVSLTYSVVDGRGGSLAATQSLTIAPESSPVNRPPTGAPTAVLPAGVEDVVTVITLASLLQGFSDPDGDPLDITGLSASVGTIAPGAGDTFTLTAPADFSGAVSLTYTVIDGRGGTLPATQSLIIEPEEPPAGELLTAGLVLELQSDANVAIVAGTSTVNGWLDGSGFGHDLSSSGAPQLVNSATPTGEAAIRFDGVDDLLQRSGPGGLAFLPDGAENRTVFFVVDYVNGRKPVGLVYGEAQNGEAFGLVATGRSSKLAVEAYGKLFDSGDVSGNNDGVGEWIVQSAVLNGTTLTHYLNGVPIDTINYAFNTDTNGAASRLVIGQTLFGDAFSSLSVAAILVYDRALSEAERQQVEAFLQEKYISGQPVTPAALADFSLALEGNAPNADLDEPAPAGMFASSEFFDLPELLEAADRFNAPVPYRLLNNGSEAFETDFVDIAREDNFIGLSTGSLIDELVTQFSLEDGGVLARTDGDYF